MPACVTATLSAEDLEPDARLITSSNSLEHSCTCVEGSALAALQQWIEYKLWCHLWIGQCLHKLIMLCIYDFMYFEYTILLACNHLHSQGRLCGFEEKRPTKSWPKPDSSHILLIHSGAVFQRALQKYKHWNFQNRLKTDLFWECWFSPLSVLLSASAN